MDIKQTVLRMFAFNKWLCRSESMQKTSKSFHKLRQYFALTVTFAEFVNFLFISGFSLVFIHVKTIGKGATSLQSYAVFDHVSVWWFVAFLSLGLMQLIAMLIPSLRASKASGLCMVASSLAWGVVGGAFYASQFAMITSATVFTGVWASATFFAGNTGIKRAIIKEQVINKGA